MGHMAKRADPHTHTCAHASRVSKKERELDEEEAREVLRGLVYKEGAVGLQSCLVKWEF